MKTIIDRQKLHRKALLSNLASVGGLLVLLASVALSLFRADLQSITTIGMLAGIGISMVGIYFANRWVRKPRPEDNLDEALKGLSDQNRFYHYPRLPCEHVLLTPTGLVVIEAVNLEGKFFYNQGRWHEKMNFGRSIRYIVEEHLGDPTRMAQDYVSNLQARLVERLPEKAKLPVDALVVFVHRRAQLEVENPPVPAIELAKLRKRIDFKHPRLPDEVYRCVQEFMDERM